MIYLVFRICFGRKSDPNVNHRVCALLFATKTFIDFIVNNKKCVLLNCMAIVAEILDTKIVYTCIVI